MAIGLFGFCVLGVFIRGASVPSRTDDQTDHTREINRDRKAVTGNPPAYQFETVDADGTLAVSNSTREIKASLHPSSGVAVESLAGEGWNCRIQLKGLGRSELMPVEGLEKSDRATSGHAVEFSGSVDQVQLTEWFENGVHGLEQGWTLSAVPDGESREKGMPLKMRLEVESDLLPRITEDRRSIAFHQVAESKAGPMALRYQNLKAFDATGASVQAWFELPESGDSGIDIMVADAGAVYPLTIDPCFAADMADKQFGDDTNDDDYFGHAIAVSGDWAAISAPGKTDGSSDGTNAALASSTLDLVNVTQGSGSTDISLEGATVNASRTGLQARDTLRVAAMSQLIGGAFSLSGRSVTIADSSIISAPDSLSGNGGIDVRAAEVINVDGSVLSSSAGDVQLQSDTGSPITIQIQNSSQLLALAQGAATTLNSSGGNISVDGSKLQAGKTLLLDTRDPTMDAMISVKDSSLFADLVKARAFNSGGRDAILIDNSTIDADSLLRLYAEGASTLRFRNNVNLKTQLAQLAGKTVEVDPGGNVIVDGTAEVYSDKHNYNRDTFGTINAQSVKQSRYSDRPAL
ncbi:MAG: FG-GAP repeat protein [Verrucomicrobiales bacterium]